MKKPRVIVWDLETLPNLQYAFGRWDPAVSHKGIVKERSIVCAGYMILGEKKVHTIQIDDVNDPYNDKSVCIKLKEVLESADLIVAHYGDKFDLPMFQGRLFLNGIPPMGKILQDDTKFMASRNMKLNSFKLDYIAQMLGFGVKDAMNINDWLNITNGHSQKALDKMVKYNIQDVKLLAKVYKALLPYAGSKLNRQQFSETKVACSACGSEHVHKHGTRRTLSNKYHRMLCNDCGHVYKGTIIKD